MWLYLTQETQLATYAPTVLGCLTLTLTLSKLTSPIAQLGCSTFLSIIVVSGHGHSELPIIMLSLITGTIMIGALHGTSSRVTNSMVFSSTTVVALTIVAAFLLIADKPMDGTAVHADSATQADAGYMHYKAFLLVSLTTLGGLELSSVSLGVANSKVRSGMVSLLATTDILLVTLSAGLALAPSAARTLISKVDSDSSNPTSATVRETSYACGMNANSPNAATSPNTSVMNVHYTLCFLYAEILILAFISAYSPSHSGLPMSPSYVALVGLLSVIANNASDYRSAHVSSSEAPYVTLPLPRTTSKDGTTSIVSTSIVPVGSSTSTSIVTVGSSKHSIPVRTSKLRGTSSQANVPHTPLRSSPLRSPRLHSHPHDLATLPLSLTCLSTLPRSLTRICQV